MPHQGDTSKPGTPGLNERARQARAYLDEVVRKLEPVDPVSLPVEMRCKYVAHLRDHILSVATQDRQWNLNAAGIAAIDEKVFSREISLLNKFNAALDYSQDLKNWLEERRKLHVIDLRRELPHILLSEHWRKANERGRLDLMADMAKRQCKTYGRGVMDFLPSKIVATTLPPGILGGTSGTYNDVISLSIPDLMINKACLPLSTAADMATTIHHEQIHLFFTQMAKAVHHNMLPAQHQFYKDGALHLEKRKYMTYVPPNIEGSHFADPEEQITHAQHKKFISEYAGQADWTRRIADIFQRPYI